MPNRVINYTIHIHLHEIGGNCSLQFPWLFSPWFTVDFFHKNPNDSRSLMSPWSISIYKFRTCRWCRYGFRTVEVTSSGWVDKWCVFFGSFKTVEIACNWWVDFLGEVFGLTMLICSWFEYLDICSIYICMCVLLLEGEERLIWTSRLNWSIW